MDRAPGFGCALLNAGATRRLWVQKPCAVSDGLAGNPARPDYQSTGERNMEKIAIYEELLKCGISELDAKIVLDCIVRKTSCSWMNNDKIKQGAEGRLNDYLKQYGLLVKISERPMTNKYIWEVKVLNK